MSAGLTRILWRWPAWNARRLAAWARAEQGSRIDLLLASAAAPDPARAAAYLRHARDEARHARMLHQRAREEAARAGRPPPPLPAADVDDLYATLGEERFLAFVTAGEARALRGFDRAAAALADADPRTAQVLGALLPDERRHAAYTAALLAGSPREGAARRGAARWALWRGWRAAGRRTARRVYLAVFALLAPALLLAAAWVRLVRPARTGWQAPDSP